MHTYSFSGFQIRVPCASARASPCSPCRRYNKQCRCSGSDSDEVDIRLPVRETTTTIAPLSPRISRQRTRPSRGWFKSSRGWFKVPRGHDNKHTVGDRVSSSALAEGNNAATPPALRTPFPRHIVVSSAYESHASVHAAASPSTDNDHHYNNHHQQHHYLQSSCPSATGGGVQLNRCSSSSGGSSASAFGDVYSMLDVLSSAVDRYD